MAGEGFGQTQVGGIGSRPVEEQIVGFIASDDIKAPSAGDLGCCYFQWQVPSC